MNQETQFREVIEILLEGGCDLDFRAYTSLESPLYRAVQLNKTDLIKVLIQCGADINIPCPFDVTVLYKACERRNLEVVTLLLHAGIDWRNETWLDIDIHHCGINQKLLHDFETQVPRILLKVPHYLNLIHNFRYNPQKLSHICRLLIRRTLGKKLHVNIQYLPLPTKLIDFLRLKVL